MIYNNKTFKVVMGIVMGLLTLACIVPFLLLLTSSLTSETALAKFGYSLFPREWSAGSYKYLWTIRSSIARAYMMSFIITTVGVILSLVVTMLFAYPLSRKDLPGRNAISFVLFFTMLFNGGFVPTYMVYTRIFHIKDTLAAMIVPYLLMNAFYVIIVRTFIMQNVPEEVLESAKIDGASEMSTLFHIVLPMSKPIIVTIGLMSAINYWNNWTNGVYFLTERTDLYGIQNFLNVVMNNVTFLQTHSQGAQLNVSVPSIGIRMAIAVLAVLPILIAYPFFQQYFVKGITIGSVKG
ncbi:MAG: carbohydrate ABC transporter permease [Eubacteriales bacterium]